MPFWEIDAGTYQQNRGGPGELGEEDDAPTAKLEGTSRSAPIGVDSPLTLDAYVIDDGQPSESDPSQSGSIRASKARSAGPCVKLDRGMRLGVVWVVYRGDARAVTFSPAKAAVGEGGKSIHDRSLQRPRRPTSLPRLCRRRVLFDVVDVTVTVRPNP